MRFGRFIRPGSVSRFELSEVKLISSLMQLDHELLLEHWHLCDRASDHLVTASSLAVACTVPRGLTFILAILPKCTTFSEGKALRFLFTTALPRLTIPHPTIVHFLRS